MRRGLHCHASCCARMRDCLCTPCFRGGRAHFREVVLDGCFTGAGKGNKKKKTEEIRPKKEEALRLEVYQGSLAAEWSPVAHVLSDGRSVLRPARLCLPLLFRKKDGSNVRLSFTVSFVVLRCAARVAHGHACRHVLSCLTKTCGAPDMLSPPYRLRMASFYSILLCPSSPSHCHSHFARRTVVPRQSLRATLRWYDCVPCLRATAWS